MLGHLAAQLLLAPVLVAALPRRQEGEIQYINEDCNILLTRICYFQSPHPKF